MKRATEDEAILVEAVLILQKHEHPQGMKI
jgi:hypothetical protein